MAAVEPKDALDALQSLLNDALVQTGRALRASRRDNLGNLPLIQMSVKLPDTIDAFHSALDEIDLQIIDAKSVLLRDLNRIKTKNNPPKSPSPPYPSQINQASSEAAGAAMSSAAVEIGSSPMPILKEEPADDITTAARQIHSAPFPDMGISDSMAASIGIDEEALKFEPPVPKEEVSFGANKASEPPTSQAPMPVMDVKPDPGQNTFPAGTDVLDLTGSDLNFTDMEFTLVPAASSQAPAPSTTADVGPAPKLETIPPQDIKPSDTPAAAWNINHTASNAMAQSASAADANPGQQKAEVPDAAFDDLFVGDGQTDGMDFDFSLGDGMGGDTFDDLMNDRDDTFDSMQHGEYDANFFGLDKADEP